MADKDVLEQESATYDREKPSLLSDSEGKYAVIKGDEVLGVFSDEKDAIAAGYKTYGNVPFLVKCVLYVDPPVNFANNTLGLFDADLQRAGH